MTPGRPLTRGATAPGSSALLALAALLALPLAATAQTGNGYLFDSPHGSFTMRAGYSLQNTSSEPFTVAKAKTTVGPRSFDSFNAGFDLNFVLTRRADLTLTMDLSTRSHTAEYRDWEENGMPIMHTSTLGRVGLGAGVRYNLVDRGRQISAMAFIPAHTIPYVGATAGLMWYDFTQDGDFVEEVDANTGNIYSARLESKHYNVMGQVFAGVERRLNARWSLLGEARYTESQARLVGDYAPLNDDIKLSGLGLNLGFTVRF